MPAKRARALTSGGEDPPNVEGPAIVRDPVKEGTGTSAFIVYEVAVPARGVTVRRRFREFLWLHDELEAAHPCMVIPPMAEKLGIGRFDPGRFNPQFIDRRRRLLQRFLCNVLTSPLLADSPLLARFLEPGNLPEPKGGGLAAAALALRFKEKHAQNNPAIEASEAQAQATSAAYGKLCGGASAFALEQRAEAHVLEKAAGAADAVGKAGAKASTQDFAQCYEAYGACCAALSQAASSHVNNEIVYVVEVLDDHQSALDAFASAHEQRAQLLAAHTKLEAKGDPRAEEAKRVLDRATNTLEGEMVTLAAKRKKDVGDALVELCDREVKIHERNRAAWAELLESLEG